MDKKGNKENVILSPLAEKKLLMLLTWLQENWSEKVKDEFILKLKESVHLIALDEHVCLQSGIKKGIFKYNITRQTALYFRKVNDIIEIITITDNRQNPRKIQKEIKKLFG